MPDTPYYALASVLRYQYRFYAYGGMLTSDYPRGLFGDARDAVVDAPPPLDEPVVLPTRPRMTKLFLGKGSKRLIVLAIVLGVLVNGSSARFTVNASHHSGESLDQRHHELEVAFRQSLLDAQTCADVTCVRAADGRAIAALVEFRSALADIEFPNDALGQASTVDGDAALMIALLRQLQEASDAATRQQLATSINEAAQKFDDDYRELYTSVRFR
jgi:hypothetical protein